MTTGRAEILAEREYAHCGVIAAATGKNTAFRNINLFFERKCRRESVRIRFVYKYKKITS